MVIEQQIACLIYKLIRVFWVVHGCSVVIAKCISEAITESTLDAFCRRCPHIPLVTSHSICSAAFIFHEAASLIIKKKHLNNVIVSLFLIPTCDMYAPHDLRKFVVICAVIFF